MIDLKAKPFYLNDAQIAWVRDTLAGMTQEEKIGQLFVLMTYMPGVDENRINVKGTTTEGLGFTGSGEGIAAQSVASIYR